MYKGFDIDVISLKMLDGNSNFSMVKPIRFLINIEKYMKKNIWHPILLVEICCDKKSFYQI